MANNSSNFRVRKGLTIFGTTSGEVNIASPAVAGTQSYTLPTAVPAVNGYVLASTTGGVMSWVDNSAAGTTYDFNATSTTGGANLNLVGSDATTDTVKLTNGGHITATYASGTAVTLGSDATDANTANAIVSRDASGNFSASGATLGNIAVGVTTDQTISTTSGDLILDSASGIVRVIDSQYNSRNSSFTAPALPITTSPYVGTNGLAVGSSTGYGNEISLTAGILDGATSVGTYNQIPNAISFRASNGSTASPVATGNNVILGSTNYDGYTTAGWASSIATSNFGGSGNSAWPLQVQTYARTTYASGTYTQSVTSASWAAGVATFNMALTNTAPFGQFQTVTITGVTPSGYNGTYVVQLFTNTASVNRFTVNLASDPGAYVSGGTITGTTVTNAGTGFRVRGIPASGDAGGAVPARLNYANRINFMDLNAASTIFKSAAYTFQDAVITGSTLTAVNYLNITSTGSTFIAPYAGVAFSFPLKVVGKRTDNVNPQDGDNTSIQYQLFGSGSNFVNLGSQTMTYKTSGDNSIDFKLENNAGPSVTTTPITISAPITTFRAGTNAAVSDIVTIEAAKVSFVAPVKFPTYTAAAANAITGAVGWQVSISNSPTVGGRMAFWDTTNARWSYISDNSAV